MDATYIARKTAGLTGLVRAAAFGSLASDVVATMDGTLTTDELLAANALHMWLTSMQRDAARNA